RHTSSKRDWTSDVYSSDPASLGTTLLPSMIDALRRNSARGQKDGALFGVEQVSLPRLPESERKPTPMPAVTQRPSEAELDELARSEERRVGKQRSWRRQRK